MFDDRTAAQIVAVAKQHGIEPAALLSVVEIESAGKMFEADGKTPTFLFERHIFYRMLASPAQPAKLQQAVAQGLAYPKWTPTSQYKDEGTSAGRMAVLARARAIDVEAANCSCSWGVGQTMGFNHAYLGYKTATAMVEAMTAGGLAVQVSCMIGEIKHDGSLSYLNAHDWAGFARIYNGPGYAANHYDTKLAAAYAVWRARAPKLPTMPAPSVPLAPTPKPPAPTTPKRDPFAAAADAVLGVLRRIFLGT